MSEEDVSYFQQRAEAELERAQLATKPEVVHAHYEMANAYLARIGKPVKQPAHA